MNFKIKGMIIGLVRGISKHDLNIALGVHKNACCKTADTVLSLKMIS